MSALYDPGLFDSDDMADHGHHRLSHLYGITSRDKAPTLELTADCTLRSQMVSQVRVGESKELCKQGWIFPPILYFLYDAHQSK